MLLAALLAYLIAAGNGGMIPSEGPPPPAELADLRVRLMTELNAHRGQFGLSPLTVDLTAEKAAQFQAEDCLHAGQMRHEDSSGRQPLQRFESYGGKADYYGENLGFHSPGVIDPILLWGVIGALDEQMMAETPPNDGHRRNILSHNFNSVGIGIAVGASGVFMAEDFVGRLAPPTPLDKAGEAAAPAP